jgi:hypothetical protein
MGGAAKKYERKLHITVSEDLDYESEFGGIFQKYAKAVALKEVKTSKMGSLYVLKYRLRLKAANTEKNLIDELRVKNANLPVSCNTLPDNDFYE